jgi:alpha-amylase
MIKKLVFLGMTILVLAAGCVPNAKTSDSETSMLVQGTNGFPWWNDTTFYEIFVRSFFDSNGDGNGDIRGLIQKLDYLNDGNPVKTTDLGVTGIYLMPINSSPSYHGYDVMDYYAINPDYGTLDDFKELLKQAHNRGIRVIVDMVMNHTSNEHPWFKEAVDPLSQKHDWYIWANPNTDLQEKGPWGQRVWCPINGQYYFALFSEDMPDLNYENPEVVAEMDKVVTFWLKEVGVDGFRLDAVKHLIEENPIMQNTAKTHTYLQHLRQVIKAINPNALIVGEVFGDSTEVLSTYLQGDQLDLVFDFNSATAFLDSAKTNNASSAMGQVVKSYSELPGLHYALFLTNHDQNRSYITLSNKVEKMRGAVSILLTSPGVPFIYYGEEVGLIGIKPDEQIRAPMQWTGEENAGFTTGTPWEAIGIGLETNNVAVEIKLKTSLLSFYRNLIHLRHTSEALRTGNLVVLDTGNNPGIYAILRSTQNETILVLINLTKNPIMDYSIGVNSTGLKPGIYQVDSLLGSIKVTDLIVPENGSIYKYKPVDNLPPYTTLIAKFVRK